jgi:hypothetical protein
MPPFITVSPGSVVTSADLQAFNERWISPEARDADIFQATFPFNNDYLRGAWGTGEDMEAMVRMYELTHDHAYLDHLRGLSNLVLSFRDDRRTDDKAGRREAFRGQVMAAWGAPGIAYGYLHHTSPVLAGVYAYPIAAFARIVAEHPPLWAAYGDDAIQFANATLETLEAFSNELSGPPEDPTISYYVYPRTYRLLTPERCEKAYDDAKNGLGPDSWAVTDDIPDPDWLEGQNRACGHNRKLAKFPLAHNQNHALHMAMIEAWRAVDSAFYAQRAGGNALAEWAKTFFPMQIRRTFRWFARNTHSPDGPGGRLSWNGADLVPEGIRIEVEDTSHGELTLRYLGVLHRNSARLNGALPPGEAPIDLTLMRRQLRRTFLEKVARGNDFAHRVDGSRVADDAPDKYNHCCAGWLDLIGDDASADAQIFEKCRDVLLRVVNRKGDDGQLHPVQAYLLNINHAALLAHKVGLTPAQTTVPDVREKNRPRAAEAIRAAGLVPRFTGEGTWVQRQHPRPGEVVDRGSTVDCGLRSGPIL